ncbi:hypothetical protein J6590_076289 [Homalodisca vitripennis]|nr:hypothetical protein J6590_076289 [Homalodisca vitripennis]
MATKPKYKCLSLSEKKEVIAAVESGKAKSEVAKTFQIPASTLSTILKNKQKIVEVSSVAGRKRTTKEKAKAYAKELGIPSFAASEGWLTNFKNVMVYFLKRFVEKALALATVCVPIGVQSCPA